MYVLTTQEIISTKVNHPTCIPVGNDAVYVERPSEEPPGPRLVPELRTPSFATLLGLAGTAASRPARRAKHWNPGQHQTTLAL